MFVKLMLKDGTVINKCTLYPQDVKNGDLPYSNVEEINDQLRKVHWGIKYVSFQSESMQGQIHVNNIVSYEYVE